MSMYSDETWREVASVAARCKECGTATRVLMHEKGRDDEGRPTSALWGEDVPHDRAECARFQALEQETWPRLF